MNKSSLKLTTLLAAMAAMTADHHYPLMPDIGGFTPRTATLSSPTRHQTKAGKARKAKRKAAKSARRRSRK